MPVTAWLLTLGLGLLSPPPAVSAVSEAELEAMVLLRMLPFFQWPQTEAVRRLCIFDDAAARGPLERQAAAHATEIIVLPRHLAGLERCHAVFVDGGIPARLPAVAAASNTQALLIVAKGPQSLERGAAVALSLAGSRMVFDVRRSELQRRNLSASAQFLRLAREVLD